MNIRILISIPLFESSACSDLKQNYFQRLLFLYKIKFSNIFKYIEMFDKHKISPISTFVVQPLKLILDRIV